MKPKIGTIVRPWSKMLDHEKREAVGVAEQTLTDRGEKPTLIGVARELGISRWTLDRFLNPERYAEAAR
jgi:hypothetical protein